MGPGALANLTEQNPVKMNEIYEARAEALLAVDEMIGSLMNELQSLRMLDNTYIFFCSDNGYHLGQHRLPPGKRLFFQHDLKVPLIVRGLGVPENATITQLTG